MSSGISIALVTGAAVRVGRAISLELAKAGCDIAIHFNRSENEAKSLSDEIRRLHRKSLLIQGDLSSPGSWQDVVSQAVEGLGGLDILVNNAAEFRPMRLEDFNPEEWERTFRLNVTSVAALCHYAAPHLRSGGGGRIVNVCDISAERPWSDHLAYCSSKAALVNLTRALARSLSPEICVNAVAPGIAVFPGNYDADTRARLVGKVPLGRPGTPGDVAGAVRFLCIEAGYITGQVINVDGGRSIS